MKKIIINCIIVFGLFMPHLMQAQGTTTYLSNLSQISSGSQSAGSDSWLASVFLTGSNPSGYVLNSVQLGMSDASGNPSDFTVMIYTSNGVGGPFPGSSIGTLDGSLNPVTPGTYDYNDDSNITLSRNTFYFIVLTAGTTVANGAYDWSLATANSYNPSGGWSWAGYFNSSNGSSWNYAPSIFPQFSINATPVPEPAAWALLLLGGGVFLCVHGRKSHSAPAATMARKSR
jgi:hypothetical protein